jgi:hypothetical protein
MLAAGLSVIVVGIILLFLLPWVGIVLGLVGIVLTVLYLFGFGRRATRSV